MADGISVRGLQRADHEAWSSLWAGYNAFYERVIPDSVTAATWARLLEDTEPMHGMVAERDGRVIGFVHSIFHRSTALLNPTCYLQDLFTAAEARGQGAGRALIEAVYAQAEAAGSARVYWLTHETNTTARALYDAIATRSGFIQYRKDLAG